MPQMMQMAGTTKHKPSFGYNDTDSLNCNTSFPHMKAYGIKYAKYYCIQILLQVHKQTKHEV
jgi:hypothetical protein